ncbi:MAG: endospore germination permease [Lachnospiraceae bacterium]|nr:endospore germination permease [Lachnospiraceae bacterium]
MLWGNGKISIRQLQSLIIIDTLGMGIVGLPALVSEFSGQSGYVATLFAGAVVLGMSLIYGNVLKAFPQKSFSVISKKLLGGVLGTIVVWLLVIRLILEAGFELRFFCEIIKETMLPKTPPIIVAFIMIAMSFWFSQKGYETRGRLAEIILPISVVVIGIVFILASLGNNATNVIPVFENGAKGFFKASLVSLSAFGGVELVFIAGKFLNHTEEKEKGFFAFSGNIGKNIFFASVALVFLMVFISTVTIARFGADETKDIMWPVIKVMQIIDFPGSIFERQDVFMMWFWIVSAFAAVNKGVFLPSVITSENKQAKTRLIISSALAFAIAIFPYDFFDIYKLIIDIRCFFALIYMIALPMLFFISLSLRRETNEK